MKADGETERQINKESKYAKRGMKQLKMESASKQIFDLQTFMGVTKERGDRISSILWPLSNYKAKQ